MEENLASQDAAGETRPASASQSTSAPAPSDAESEATVLYEGRETSTSSPADTPVAVNAEEVIAPPALTSELEESPTLLATGHPAETPAANEAEAATQPGEEQAEPPTLIMPLEPHPEEAALPTAHTQDEQLPAAPAPYTLDPSAASRFLSADALTAPGAGTAQALAMEEDPSAGRGYSDPARRGQLRHLVSCHAPSHLEHGQLNAEDRRPAGGRVHPGGLWTNRYGAAYLGKRLFA